MIVRFQNPSVARGWCAALRERKRSLGFVPTMGALHAGHLELVRCALAENDAACVSVFVNPLQFNEKRDFERYPRDFEHDARLLDEIGCSMVFTGTLASFFPRELRANGEFDPHALRAPGPAAVGLEGAHRPGHFAGVATIVERLFEVVRPTRAYFGRKDYQQTLVVRDLARRLSAPEIVVCPTSREASGLARSSRNELLSPEDRVRATAIIAGLRAARSAWKQGERDAWRLSETIRARIVLEPAFELEYAAVRDPEHWTADEPRGAMERAIALVAARIGGVRLIDNLRLDAPDDEA